MKIALVTPRFIKEDMRGGEEVIRSLYNSMACSNEVSILTSNAYDIKGEHSILGKFVSKEDKVITTNEQIVNYIPSFPFISELLYYLRYPLVYSLEKLRVKPYSFYIMDFMRIYGWGPYIPGIKNEILPNRYDIVHASIFPTTSAYLALKYANESGTPFVFTPYYHYLKSEFNVSKILSKMLKKSQAIVACTNREADELYKIGASPETTHVIPLGFDSAQLKQYGLSKELARYKLGIGEGAFTILTHPWIGKGGGTVFKAAVKLSNQQTDVTLLTIGEPDKSYLEMRGLVNTSNLQQIDLGWVQKEAKWLAFYACDVFAMPSINDSFGLSYLNAWAAEKPVIAAKNSFAEDIVIDKINGFLVEHSDCESIFRILLELSKDINNGLLLGKNGKAILDKNYSEKEMSRSYAKLFESLVF